MVINRDDQRLIGGVFIRMQNVIGNFEDTRHISVVTYALNSIVNNFFFRDDDLEQSEDIDYKHLQMVSRSNSFNPISNTLPLSQFSPNSLQTSEHKHDDIDLESPDEPGKTSETRNFLSVNDAVRPTKVKTKVVASRSYHSLNTHDNEVFTSVGNVNNVRKQDSVGSKKSDFQSNKLSDATTVRSASENT